jgi:iron complex transport system substrate-binding protein
MNREYLRSVNLFTIISLVLMTLLVCGCTETIQPQEMPVSDTNATGTNTITDMMGQTVILPANITAVVTVGSVPVMNSFIEAMGEADTIANALPASFVKNGRWEYQYIFAPQIEDAPTVQDTSGDLSVESTMSLYPDVVFTMDKTTVNTLEDTDINVVYLQWTNSTDAKRLMTLMGQVYSNNNRADEYNQYFDSRISFVNETVGSVPEEERPKVLFFSPKTLKVPHKICEWWITEAGGIAVSQNNRTSEAFTFDMEQLLEWDPDVIITTTPSEVEYIYNDQVFSGISAVKNKQIYTTPVGAHVWGHRGIETPLMVEWTASKLYPARIKEAQVFNDTASFYQQFFGIALSTNQVNEILNGTAGI